MLGKYLFDNKDNFYYGGIDVDYEGETNCEDYGCDSEGICRCFRIDRAWVSRISLYNIMKAMLPVDTSEITKYAYVRLLVNSDLIDPDSWDVESGGGYYGDEIYGVYLNAEVLNSANKLIEQFLECQSDNERMEFVLKLEYGSLPSTKMTYSLILVDLDTIEIPNVNHFEKCTGDYFYSGMVQTDLILSKNRKIGWDCLDSNGLCLVRGNSSKSVLVDGYHRLASYKNVGFETAKVIMGTEIK